MIICVAIIQKGKGDLHTTHYHPCYTVAAICISKVAAYCEELGEGEISHLSPSETGHHIFCKQ